MASYGQYKDIPSPSPSLSSNTSRSEASSWSHGISGVSGINRSNNVTATLKKSSANPRSPRNIGPPQSPLPPMIGGTGGPNHNGLGHSGLNSPQHHQNPYNNSHPSVNSSSPSSSLSNLGFGALSKRFTVRNGFILEVGCKICVSINRHSISTILKQKYTL